MRWTEEEMILLKDKYHNTKNEDLSIILNRSVDSIMNLAYRLKLKKSKDHKSKMIGIRNKIYGRDLEDQLLKDIALKYKTRTEFQISDSSAYRSGRKLKILDQICSHMISQSFSIPQLILKDILSQLLGDDLLYNTRQIIKPYELDIYFPKYKLAFEYNGKGWHINDRINKTNLCKEMGIELFTIVENNRKYENDIKNQLISFIDEINNCIGYTITKSQIENVCLSDDVYSGIINDDYIKKICDEYSDYHLFITQNNHLYQRLKRLNKLSEYTNHMVKSRIPITEEEVINEISKFSFIDDFIKKSNRCYSWIKRNKKEHLMRDLKYKQNKKFIIGLI